MLKANNNVHILNKKAKFEYIILDRYTAGIVLYGTEIKSIREGEVPGIHTIRYESGVDSIEITHDAKSREGFALGAVLAAEFTAGKKGFYTTEDMFKF